MKMKLLICLLAVVVILVNCSKDDDTSATYVGTWIATNVNVEDCENFTLNETRAVQCTDNSCYRLILTDSSVYSFQRGQDFEVGMWAADGATLSFVVDDEGTSITTQGSGILTSAGLTLSIAEGSPGCVTIYIMEREEEEEVVDDGN